MSFEKDEMDEIDKALREGMLVIIRRSGDARVKIEPSDKVKVIERRY